MSCFCFLSCFHASLVTVPVAFPPSLLSVDPVFHFPCSSPAAFTCLSSFCFSSCDFFPPASCILHHPFCIFIRRFRFPVWFCTLERIQNEGKNEGKIHDKQELAHRLPHPATTAITTIATAGPSYAFAAGICLTSTSKAPAKHQQHHHHAIAAAAAAAAPAAAAAAGSCCW